MKPTSDVNVGSMTETAHHPMEKLREQWVRDLIERLSRDMKFVGVYNCVVGIISSMSIIGAIWGIPIIFYGVRAVEAAKASRDFNHNGNIDALIVAFDKMRSYFFINKVLAIVNLILVAAYFFVVIFFLNMALWPETVLS